MIYEATYLILSTGNLLAGVSECNQNSLPEEFLQKRYASHG